MRQTSDLVGLFLQGHAFFQVLEFHLAAHFAQDREGERVPSRQQLILRDSVAGFDQNVRAINNLITRDFTAALIEDR